MSMTVGDATTGGYVTRGGPLRKPKKFGTTKKITKKPKPPKR